MLCHHPNTTISALMTKRRGCVSIVLLKTGSPKRSKPLESPCFQHFLILDFTSSNCPSHLTQAPAILILPHIAFFACSSQVFIRAGIIELLRYCDIPAQLQRKGKAGHEKSSRANVMVDDES
jgi:hypothetical protein